jgi:hypothetical protein
LECGGLPPLWSRRLAAAAERQASRDPETANRFLRPIGIEAAFTRDELDVISFSDSAEFQIIAKLSSAGLATGGAVSIVAAVKLQAALAIDDTKVTRTALKTYPQPGITSTSTTGKRPQATRL